MREEARHRAARGRAASAELQHVPSLAGARARHPYPSQVITVKGARDDGLQVDVYAPMPSEIVHTTVVDRRELFALGLRDARVPRVCGGVMMWWWVGWHGMSMGVGWD